MRIRSITCFFNPGLGTIQKSIDDLSSLANFCRDELEKIGWEVQTIRLATTPFGSFSPPESVIRKVCHLEKIAEKAGFNYLSIGPARLSYAQDYAIIPEILHATENVFTSAFLAHHFKGISRQAVRACAEIITTSASISPDGFTNLRFCAMSQVQPFTPFFPAAYSYGTQPAFSAAIECADAALEIFQAAGTINNGKKKLLNKLEQASQEMGRVFRKGARRFTVPFKGFDFSLAPFPEDWCSLGAALEVLGVQQLGFMGSITAAAILAETLDQGRWKRVGFNGLMLPVLEDSRLADRSSSTDFSVKDLLLYSTMCGTGLDTLPLPGDIQAEKIEPLLMDLAALSLRLNKPLTARLMPIPGLNAGDQTKYDFAFFKNGRVMDFPAQGINRLLDASQWVKIRGRPSYS